MNNVSFDEVFIEINELSSLENNWDGEGAHKLLAETIISSLTVAKLLEGKVAMVPDISPEYYGTVSFDWVNDYGLIHLEVGKTKYSMFASDRTGTTSTFFFNGLTENIENDILEIILAINLKLEQN